MSDIKNIKELKKDIQEKRLQATRSEQEVVISLIILCFELSAKVIKKLNKKEFTNPRFDEIRFLGGLYNESYKYDDALWELQVYATRLGDILHELEEKEKTLEKKKKGQEKENETNTTDN